MKSTRTLLVSFLCLSALPISLAAGNCRVRDFKCNPFGPDACGSIYIKPKIKETPPLNLPMKIANALYTIASGVLVEEIDPLPLLVSLINLPKSFASDKGDESYEVTDKFINEMELNVKNYVTQTVSTAQLAGLYDGIANNNLRFSAINTAFQEYQLNKDNEAGVQLKKDLRHDLGLASFFFLNQYSQYEHGNPNINPQETIDSTKTGKNGWGLYYSVFISQFLVALMQEITFKGPKTSGSAQQQLVQYVWKAIKHSQELVNTYALQREGDITGPLLIEDVLSQKDFNAHHHTTSVRYQINDTWAYSNEGQEESCSWREKNSISFEEYHPQFCPRGEAGQKWCGPYSTYGRCRKSTEDWFFKFSSRCSDARKQFVTGEVISNWNMWLIEPSKQWAKIADMICEKTTDSLVKTRCKNQGEDTYKHFYNIGGTAVDFINTKEGKYVFGTFNTNICPTNTTHITDRTVCTKAYNELVKTHRKLSNHVDYEYNWPDFRWPAGCNVNRDNNGVYFNEKIGGNDAGVGQPICIGVPSSFVMGRLGTNNCPKGTMHVTDQSQCNEAYIELRETNPELHNPVNVYDFGTARPTGCSVYRGIVRGTNTVQFNTGEGGDTAGDDQPICYSNSNERHNIQQTCQRNNPGMHVIATKTKSCKDYYKASTPFIGSDNANVPGWMCCHLMSDVGLMCHLNNGVKGEYPYLILFNTTDQQACNTVSNDLGCGDCMNKEQSDRTVLAYRPNTGIQQCSADYNSKVDDHAGHVGSCPYDDAPYCINYVMGSRNGYCSHTKASESFVIDCSHTTFSYEECNVWPYYLEVNTATTMLVGSSNEIHEESNMSPLFMLGFLCLAIVATLKFAKDYRVRQPHLEQYNELE